MFCSAQKEISLGVFLQPMHKTIFLPDEVSQFANPNVLQSYSVSPIISELIKHIDSTNLAYRFLILSGPSGVGKSRIISSLKSAGHSSINWKLIKRVTTRSRRPFETDAEATFITDNEFRNMEKRGGLLYSELYAGNLSNYGLDLEEVIRSVNGADNNTVMVVVGTLALTYLLPRSCYVYLLPPSLIELERRIAVSKKPNAHGLIRYNTQEMKTVLSAHNSMLVKSQSVSLISNDKGLEFNCVKRLDKFVRLGQGLTQIPTALISNIHLSSSIRDCA